MPGTSCLAPGDPHPMAIPHAVRFKTGIGPRKLLDFVPKCQYSDRSICNIGTQMSTEIASAKAVQKSRTSPTHNSMLVKVGGKLLTCRRTAWYPADVQQIIAKRSRLGLTNPNLIREIVTCRRIKKCMSEYT